jgi:hypothetical protein
MKKAVFWDNCFSSQCVQLLVTANVLPSSLIHCTLMLVAKCSSETPVPTRAILCSIPEGGILNICCFNYEVLSYDYNMRRDAENNFDTSCGSKTFKSCIYLFTNVFIYLSGVEPSLLLLRPLIGLLHQPSIIDDDSVIVKQSAE